jgi:hypothetical protein
LTCEIDGRPPTLVPLPAVGQVPTRNAATLSRRRAPQRERTID